MPCMNVNAETNSSPINPCCGASCKPSNPTPLLHSGTPLTLPLQSPSCNLPQLCCTICLQHPPTPLLLLHATSLCVKKPPSNSCALRSVYPPLCPSHPPSETLHTPQPPLLHMLIPHVYATNTPLPLWCLSPLQQPL